MASAPCTCIHRTEISDKDEAGEGGYSIACMAVVVLTIDPRISTMPGRSTSGFHGPGRHCLHQARSDLEVFGESHEGWAAASY